MEQLSRKIRPEAVLDLPEKVLQFGGGVFLRGFLGDLVDRAGRSGIFGGRIVIVQRERDRRAEAFRAQDGLYTLWLREMEDRRPREQFRLLGAVSRVLAADTEWVQVKELARSPELEVVVSNATEVGYATTAEDRLDAGPPPSFPAKLTALLQERWAHGGTGLVIVPCELLERNGEKLRQTVLDLARQWRLPTGFLDWVQQQNTFCCTLVDRIVTGPPDPKTAEEAWRRLGYRDELLIAAEPFALFAIEDAGKARSRFPLDRAAPEVLYVEDVRPYWRRKLRLLNAPHTLLAAQGVLRGFGAVREALQDPELRACLEKSIFEEIIPSMGQAERSQNEAYARKVLERFDNPFVEHRLLNICVQCSTKVGVRLFPIIHDYRQATGKLPRGILRGIAGVLLFLRGSQSYAVNDANAHRFQECWQQASPSNLVEFTRSVLEDPFLWGNHRTDAEALAGPLAEELAALMGPPSCFVPFSEHS